MVLQTLREKSNLSRRELSKLSGISFRSLQDYEQGHKNIAGMKADTLYRLSIALDCTMEELVREEILTK